jgi:hypothetical protein
MSGLRARQSLPRPAEGSASVTILASAGGWVEFDALAPCRQAVGLPGMIQVPDLGTGESAPNGAAMASTMLYPLSVSSDAGCAIAVFAIRLKPTEPARFPDLVGRASRAGYTDRPDRRRVTQPRRGRRRYLSASLGFGASGCAQRRHAWTPFLPRRR